MYKLLHYIYTECLLQGTVNDINFPMWQQFQLAFNWLMDVFVATCYLLIYSKFHVFLCLLANQLEATDSRSSIIIPVITSDYIRNYFKRELPYLRLYP